VKKKGIHRTGFGKEFRKEAGNHLLGVMGKGDPKKGNRSMAIWSRDPVEGVGGNISRRTVVESREGQTTETRSGRAGGRSKSVETKVRG